VEKVRGLPTSLLRLDAAFLLVKGNMMTPAKPGHIHWFAVMRVVAVDL
jgi:hypothetical protein